MIALCNLHDCDLKRQMMRVDKICIDKTQYVHIYKSTFLQVNETIRGGGTAITLSEAEVYTDIIVALFNQPRYLERLFDMETLCIVNAHLFQGIENLLILHKLCDGLYFHAMSDLIDRGHQGIINWIMRYITHQGTINFEVINW